MTPTQPMFMKIPDVAVALAVSRAMAYKLVQSGALPSVKIGRSRRVHVHALHQYVERLTHGSDVDATESRP